MTKPSDGQSNSRAVPKLRPRRCAIYARYSSDMQRESSIDDQIRKCKEYAAKQGWIVLEKHIFFDQAISGSKFEERASLQRLLAAAEQRPRPFDVLLMDDTSRLARYLEDAEECTFLQPPPPFRFDRVIQHLAELDVKFLE